MVYRRKLIYGLLTLLLVFVIIFALALLNNMAGRALLNTGLPIFTENLIMMVFCVLSIINVVYELGKIK